MKIEFDTDINGYHEARKFKLLIDGILARENLDASLTSFAEGIRSQLAEFINNPEFAEFDIDAHDAKYVASHDESAGEGIARFLRHFMGPSRRELELSKQRLELIARAERAESSAFSALSETADIGRERDELKARLKELEAELAKTHQNS